jgi:hypothetical protein
MGDERTTNQGTIGLCAEADFAIDQQLFFPFVNGLNGAKDEFEKVKGLVKKQDYQKIDNNCLKLNGLGIFSPFLVLPSQICTCQVDNVEVIKKSVIFNCERLLLCVEYMVCLKLFDQDNKPRCQEIKASFNKEIDRYDFEYLAPFGSSNGISLTDFLTAEGACVNVTPLFASDECFVVNFETFSAIFLTFPFKVLVKLFRTHNVTVPLTMLGAPVEKIPKKIDRCNSCFTSMVSPVTAQKIKK